MKLRRELVAQALRGNQTANVSPGQAGLRDLKRYRLKTVAIQTAKERLARRKRNYFLLIARQSAGLFAGRKAQLSQRRWKDNVALSEMQMTNQKRWSGNCRTNREDIAPTPSATAPETTRLKLLSPDPFQLDFAISSRTKAITNRFEIYTDSSGQSGFYLLPRRIFRTGGFRHSMPNSTGSPPLFAAR